MLYTIAVIVGILWLLGLMTSFMMGGLIHILLVIAIVLFVLGIIGGRKPQ
ncbi:MAG: lmo0937 family membrane protein [Nitrosospira sp.]|nr:lmo0937 family membrane protein [Nitrosospira sp.]